MRTKSSYYRKTIPESDKVKKELPMVTTIILVLVPGPWAYALPPLEAAEAPLLNSTVVIGIIGLILGVIEIIIAYLSVNIIRRERFIEKTREYLAGKGKEQAFYNPEKETIPLFETPKITYEGRVVTLDKVPLTIGRSEDADIRIPDSKRLISRIHAKIYLDDAGVYWIEDNNSTNGTFICRDGKYERVEKWALRNGDIIVLCHDVAGDQGFRMIFEGEKEMCEETKVAEAGAEVVVEGQRIELMKKVSTIGRSEDADIQVADPERLISRIHAKIYLDDTGVYWIEDNNSTNGTFICRDGKYKRVEKWALCDGDTVVLSYSHSRGAYASLQFRRVGVM